MSKQQQAQQAQAFHPENSRVGASALADFIRAPTKGNLDEVPGVGPATIDRLRAAGVETTYQLVAKYLSFKGANTEPKAHAELFYQWLKRTETPAGFRAGVVHSIAEKTNLTFPKLYDSSAYYDKDLSMEQDA